MANSTFFNRVAFLANAGGTGSFVVGSGQTGFRTPAQAGISNGALVSYTAINPANSNPTEWETGQGTYTVSTTTLARTTVRESSNSNSVVNFSQAPLVFLDLQAQDVAALGATPGGASLTVQYNNASAFGGMSGTSWDDTNRSLTLTGATVTTSNPVLNLTQTWNAGAVAFTGLKLNVTNTASAAASLLMDLQVGGNTRLNLSRDGTLILTGASGNNDQFKIDGSGAGSTGFANFWVIGDTQTYQIGVGNSSASLSLGAKFFVYDRTAGIVRFAIDGPNNTLRVGSGAIFGWANLTDATSGSTIDLGISRVASKVSSFTDGSTNAAGWMQWAGQARVTADVTFTSTTTLATVTGLSVNVQAGRTYSFVAELSWTDAAAGGLQLAIAGTATATNIIYDGYIIDSAANGIKGNAQATALGTAVASATTTGTAGHARITGVITVNAGGTLLVQAAQNTSNATATTIKRGSYFLVYDMP